MQRLPEKMKAIPKDRRIGGASQGLSDDPVPTLLAHVSPSHESVPISLRPLPVRPSHDPLPSLLAPVGFGEQGLKLSSTRPALEPSARPQKWILKSDDDGVTLITWSERGVASTRNLSESELLSFASSHARSGSASKVPVADSAPLGSAEKFGSCDDFGKANMTVLDVAVDQKTSPKETHESSRTSCPTSDDIFIIANVKSSSHSSHLRIKLASLCERPLTAFSTPLSTEFTSLYQVLKLFIINDKRGRKLSEDDLPISAVNDLANLSKIASVFFFFGGLACFQTVWAQRLYDVFFVGSFIACLGACLINYVTIRSPPFKDDISSIATIYLHVIGLHAWLFWTGFLRQLQVRRFVRKFFLLNSEKQLSKVSGHARLIFGGLLILQVFILTLGLLALPMPAWRYAETKPAHVEVASFDYQYTFIHSIIMWFVIPQHVPTVMATIGLFLLVADLHVQDIGQSMHFIMTEMLEDGASPGRGDGLNINGEMLYDLLDSTQERLNYSATRMQWLWIHQLVYCFLQIFIAMAHIRMFVTKGVLENWDHFYALCTDLFHGLFGVAAFTMVLIAPAMVTARFKEAPADFISCLRGRPEQARVSNTVPLLVLKAQGFRVMGEAISSGTVAKFMTFVGIGASVYMTIAAK